MNIAPSQKIFHSSVFLTPHLSIFKLQHDGDGDGNDFFTISSSLPWISAARTLALSVSPSITTLVAAKCCQNEDDVDDDDDDNDCISDNNNNHIAVLSN